MEFEPLGDTTSRLYIDGDFRLYAGNIVDLAAEDPIAQVGTKFNYTNIRRKAGRLLKRMTFFQ